LRQTVYPGVPKSKRVGLPAIAATITAGAAGCDPVINVAGANFPAWLLCILAGSLIAALFRPFFVLARIDPYLGPRPVIYTSLAVMFALIVWIIFFNRI
jgi:YtcA-like protein